MTIYQIRLLRQVRKGADKKISYDNLWNVMWGHPSSGARKSCGLNEADTPEGCPYGITSGIGNLAGLQLKLEFVRDKRNKL